MSRTIKISLYSIPLVILFLFSISFTGEKFDGHSKGEAMAARPIEETLKEHTKALMSIPGVVGTGQGLCEGKPCIKVFVIQKTPELDRKIPKTLDGYPVVIEETGEIKALPQK
jgi:hypothetical protein